MQSNAVASGLMRHLAIICATGLALAACGGGGGGGGGGSGDLSLSLSPSTVSQSLFAYEPGFFAVAAHVSGTYNEDVYVLIQDPAGVLDGAPAIGQSDERNYTATFKTVSTLAAGTYSGTLLVRLCADGACASELGRKSLPYRFDVSNRAPTLSKLGTNNAVAGCGPFHMTVFGGGFVPESTVTWNGESRPTQYSSPSVLRVSISGGDLASTTTAQVRVSNPLPGGGETVSLDFSVTDVGAATTPYASLQVDAMHTGIGTTRCPASPPAATPLWQKSDFRAGRPVIAEGRVFVGNYEAALLHAFDAVTGADSWGPITANVPTLGYADGSLFLHSFSTDGAVSDLVQSRDAATGEVIWSASATFPVLNPVVAGGRVFLTAYRNVLALDAATGTTLWATSFPYYPSTFNLTPSAATADALYVCGARAYAASNGASLWDVPISGCFNAPALEVPVLAGGLLYSPGVFNSSTGSSSGYVQSPADGSLMSQYETKTLPVIDGTDGFFTGLFRVERRRLADQVARWSVLDQPSTDLMRLNEWLVYGTAFGQVRALDAETGAVSWTLEVAPTLIDRIAIGDGYLFVSTGNEKVIRVYDLGGR